MITMETIDKQNLKQWNDWVETSFSHTNLETIQYFIDHP